MTVLYPGSVVGMFVTCLLHGYYVAKSIYYVAGIAYVCAPSNDLARDRRVLFIRAARLWNRSSRERKSKWLLGAGSVYEGDYLIWLSAMVHCWAMCTPTLIP